MALGQGARAALPVYGLYMQKVYADKTLPYSQDAKLEIQADFEPCRGEVWSGPSETVEAESVEGIFD